jgi:hypothetical protein
LIVAVQPCERITQLNELARDPDLAQLYQPTLLVSDSQRRYSSVRDAILKQLQPRDVIEEMWAAELIDGEWETQRLRHFKSLIVTSARRPALQNLLMVLLENQNSYDIEDLAQRFFTNKDVRRKVGAILRSFGLSESSIDAEAFRQSLGDLAEINRRLAELASRRDKILQRLEDHRAGLATPTHFDQCVSSDGVFGDQNDAN